jgi:hypothetical protein
MYKKYFIYKKYFLYIDILHLSRAKFPISWIKLSPADAKEQVMVSFGTLCPNEQYMP